MPKNQSILLGFANLLVCEYIPAMAHWGGVCAVGVTYTSPRACDPYKWGAALQVAFKTRYDKTAKCISRDTFRNTQKARFLKLSDTSASHASPSKKAIH